MYIQDYNKMNTTKYHVKSIWFLSVPESYKVVATDSSMNSDYKYTPET